MPQARIETGTNGRVEIHGELNFASVALLWNTSRQCLRREVVLGNVGKHPGRVEKNGVAADRVDDGDAGVTQLPAEVLHLADARVDVVIVDTLGDSDCERLHVPTSHAAVGVQAFVNND